MLTWTVERIDVAVIQSTKINFYVRSETTFRAKQKNKKHKMIDDKCLFGQVWNQTFACIKLKLPVVLFSHRMRTNWNCELSAQT